MGKDSSYEWPKGKVQSVNLNLLIFNKELRSEGLLVSAGLGLVSELLSRKNMLHHLLKASLDGFDYGETDILEMNINSPPVKQPLRRMP